MQIIQSITVASVPAFIFNVGGEHNERVIIEIKQVGEKYPDHLHSEYWVLDEDDQLIVSIENAPVIVEYRQIVEHEDNEK
ncbi:hypothetical protein [Paenibacillus odorifer]|uniref:hypothetical protein n=1 Tax=Paenibacillus odorifer TaxID=189426 RepID=UPI002DC03835|nr:hypothetical protein [Paenibacillus odorifer]MEC0131495.1 hypothetical protein [Paenibacillus odorifer]MEC0220352.1 hypothetical protein [Paenibacillus odorifer]